MRCIRGGSAAPCVVVELLGLTSVLKGVWMVRGDHGGAQVHGRRQESSNHLPGTTSALLPLP